MAVRRERVILELEDRFTGPLARAAAATKAFEGTVDDLDRTTVRTDRTLTRTASPSGSVSSVRKQASEAGREIDRFSGRLRLLMNTAAVLGPALVPIGAVAVPAVAGLASQLGFAALAGGTAIVAFQGVGDALKAMNAAHLEPTAENLDAARAAMEALSPAAREAVREMRQFVPLLRDARDAAASGFFPGFVESLDAIRTRMPDVERILLRVGDTVGDILSGGAESLASSRWDDFFEFLATDATSALRDIAAATGNVVHGLAEMWMAFDPLNDDFSSWMVGVTEDFDRWAEGLARTDGFAEFVDYIQANGPRVAEALGAIGNAVLQIVEAAAPIGGPVLVALEAFADVVALIADSDLGTPLMAAVTAMSALRLATAATNTQLGTLIKNQILARNGFGEMGVKMAGLGEAAGVIAGVTLATSDLGDRMTGANTAAGALIGTMGGPWGIALGAAAGLVIDLSHANDELEASMRSVQQAFESGTAAEQREELAGLRDEINAMTIDVEDGSDVWALLANPLDAAGAAFSALSGTTGAARREYRMFRQELRGTGLAGLLTGPLRDINDGFLSAEEAMDKFIGTFQRLEGLLSRRQSLVDYERALDDLAKTAKDNEFNPDFEKGRRGLENLNGLVEAALVRSKLLREEGDKLGAQRILRRAISDLESFGKRSPAAERAVADLIERLDALDKKHAQPEADVDNKPAKRKIEEVTSWLLDYSKKRPSAHVDADASAAWDVFFNVDRWQPKAKTVVVNTKYIGASNAGVDLTRGADGMTVPGPRRPYGDKVLAYLAPGEEVISNRHGQADRNRELLQAINANRYADGGPVGGHRAAARWAPPLVSVGSPNVNVGGPRIQVFIDGKEVRALVRSELADDRELDSTLRGF